MTLSPRQDHDDSLTSDSLSNDADRAEADALPPTLFALPNLIAESGPESDSQDQDQTPKPGPPAVPTAISTPATEPSKPTPKADQQPATGPRPAPERPIVATIHDQPAGRSWMETARSHGVMIVLLLLVVTAAIWTSRPSSNETVTAESEDLLDFSIDDGVTESFEVAAQIPPQLSSETDPAEFPQEPAQPLEPEVQPAPQGASEIQIAEVPQNTLAQNHNSPAHAMSPELAAPQLPGERSDPTASSIESSVEATAPAVASGTSGLATATPEPPTVTPELAVTIPGHSMAKANPFASNELASAESLPAEAPGMSGVAQLAPKSDAIVAHPASARIPANSSDVGLPSISEVMPPELESKQTSGLDPRDAARATSTPKGVVNWLQYLPPMPNK